jgi:hypothetical protein
VRLLESHADLLHALLGWFDAIHNALIGGAESVVGTGVALRTGVDMGCGFVTNKRTNDGAANLGVGVGVVGVPNRDGDTGVVVHSGRFGPTEFGVDEQVVVIGVDPHHVGHGMPRFWDNGEGGEVLAGSECFDLWLQHGYQLTHQ